MTAAASRKLQQRADYTHKHNLKTGRHGWLRLTPAYSVKIVEEIIAQSDPTARVLDPFCGTATTALSAAYHGHESVTTDINPFLIWLGSAKIDRYSAADIATTQHLAERALDLVRKDKITPTEYPPIHNIERWWPEAALSFLTRLQAAIRFLSKPSSKEYALLSVAFCRTLISISNAAFNHQSMSFKDERQVAIPFGMNFETVFRADVQFVLDGASDNPSGNADVQLADARHLADAIHGPFDLVVTSPPYANRMSYIRELRPYMYWLGFLRHAREAGELDWKAIGGTWGIATSRLTKWNSSSNRFRNPDLDFALGQIAHNRNKNGLLLSAYVAKYFEDMWLHLQNLISILNRRAEIHYIVGNSTFYGALLPVEKLYAAMLDKLGFVDIECRPIRKRNSKKELVEFDVVAKWIT
ncbi:MAG: hypothetical protein AB7K35_04870 [Pseudorhodoplanes sp.]